MEEDDMQQPWKSKWIFILYLAIHGQIYTKDKLEKWGILTDYICPLCDNEPESHQNLFFECIESSRIWNKLLNWMTIIRGSKGWNKELN